MATACPACKTRLPKSVSIGQSFHCPRCGEWLRPAEIPWWQFWLYVLGAVLTIPLVLIVLSLAVPTAHRKAYIAEDCAIFWTTSDYDQAVEHGTALQLLSNGRGGFVKGGTAAEILGRYDPDLGRCRVKLLAGPHVNRRGYVSCDKLRLP